MVDYLQGEIDRLGGRLAHHHASRSNTNKKAASSSWSLFSLSRADFLSCTECYFPSHLTVLHAVELQKALMVVFFVAALLLWKIQQKQQQSNRPRARTDSRSHYSTRTRGPSNGGDSVFFNDNLDDVVFPSEHSKYYLNIKDQPHDDEYAAHRPKSIQDIEYHGPNRKTVEYATWTPPPSWGEASRYLLPHRSLSKLERRIALQIPVPACLSIQEEEPRKTATSNQTKKDADNSHILFELPIQDFSVHTKTPPEGGVLEIYYKESPREEWMEHTFVSAREAAQFQVDLLALQLFGDAIHHMYQALELAHRGSLAYDGKEMVLHDTECDEVVQPMAGGIAWDDVMRCLGSSFPSIRISLEALWWLEMTASTTPTSSPSSPRHRQGTGETEPKVESSEKDINNYNLQSEYWRKRLLLGPVDFFRLFVPKLPSHALPKSKSSQIRMEQMLRWRKRVARAAVLVNAYAKARMVVNQGWKLPVPLPEKYLKRRLAYDDNTDNYLRDSTAENEYYEATVSRDVLCEVRNIDFFKKRRWWMLGFDKAKPTLSPCQGYTSVGMHYFQLPSDEADCALHYTKDPVLAIPSLRAVIEDHPELDFFVSSFFRNDRNAVIIHVYVRSLPKGIDLSFDSVVEKYVNGSKEDRDRKLECVVQLGVDIYDMPLTGRIILLLLSFLLRLTLWGRAKVAQRASSSIDRTSIPAIQVAALGGTFHFGGSLQTDRSLPMNYVAHTACVDSLENVPFATRILLAYLQKGGLENDVVDLTFVLAGEDEEEFPERALATTRFVRSIRGHVALPYTYAAGADHERRMQDNDVDSIVTCSRQEESDVSLYFRVFVADPLRASIAPFSGNASRSVSQKSPTNRIQNFLTRIPTTRLTTGARILSTRDPFEKAVNQLVEILRDVKVPVRKEQIGQVCTASETQPPPVIVENALNPQPQVRQRDDIMEIPILQRIDRRDIRRYFIASDCSLKRAAVRIVDSASWRGLTFPIDTRTCRVELQNGQFFQQGRDLSGNPVYYFRHTCLGPWRHDEGAVIAAVLHRLERSLNDLQKENPEVRCTLIVVMGRPFKKKERKIENNLTGTDEDDHDDSKSPSDEEDEEHSDDDGETVEGEDGELEKATSAVSLMNNPRIHPDEHWHAHTNMVVVKRIISTVMTHYPERLRRALVVLRHGNKSYTRTAVGGALNLSKVVNSPRTREKVKFLKRYSELKTYVAEDELITLVGGSAPIDPAVFDCR